MCLPTGFKKIDSKGLKLQTKRLGRVVSLQCMKISDMGG